jgi:hypothetical protein
MSKNDVENAFIREAKGPLPDGIQLLALEFELWDGRDPWTETNYNTISRHLSSFEWVLEKIGTPNLVPANAASVFGVRPCVRVVLVIPAAKPVLDKWLLGEDYVLKKMLLQFGQKIHTIHSKFLRSLAEACDENIEDLLDSDAWKASHDQFKSGDTYEPGDFARWVRAVQITDKDFSDLAALREACNNDVEAMYAVMSRVIDDETEPQSFLVPGLIPRGAVTLLLGNKKVGKSAMALELAVAAARREQEWLGFPLDTSGGGFAVYLFGEDTPEEVMGRTKLMTGGETPWLLYTIPADGTEIDGLLSKLEKEKVALLVVDPARKFFRGDEDGSDAVNDFFTKLEVFAREKKCAVVVLHHLKRNATPRNVSDVALHYRGSSVFLDRPRAILAVIRRGEETEFGIPAPDGMPLHNFLASTMFSGVRRLRRNEADFRHVPLGVQSAAAKEMPAGDVGRVYDAALRLLTAGEHVTRTGRSEIFARKATETEGMSRAAVRAALQVSVTDGRLSWDANGVLTLPVEQASAKEGRPMPVANFNALM